MRLFKIFIREKRARDSNLSAEGSQIFLSDLDPETLRIWDESVHSAFFDDLDISADWEKVRSRIHKPYNLRSKPVAILSKVIRIAAVLILVAGLTYVIKKKNLPVMEPSGIISSEAGKSIKELTLPDGSVVTLNIGSVLTYRDDFNKGTRDVILQGEGLFNVVPGNSSPFRVFTGESVVEVTGTTFSISQNDHFVEVAVIEGKVILQFVVGPTGEITMIKVIRSADPLLDNEAIRVISSMPKWRPGKNNGNPVPVYFSLPVTFQIK